MKNIANASKTLTLSLLSLSMLISLSACTHQRVLTHPDALPNTHAPGEVDRPEMVAFVINDPATLQGVVVDDAQAELVGAWRYSTHTPPYVGVGYLHDEKQGKGAKSVTFRAQLKKGGLYEVRLAHCYNVRRATNTPVTVGGHVQGETTLRINQQQEPELNRLFRSLGRFRFSPNANAFLRISNDGTAPNKVVIADAAQWIWLEP